MNKFELTRTLIITGTISVRKKVPYLILVDEKERLLQYLNSIEFYINNSDFDTIIFGENSNYYYEHINDIYELANKSGKKFEWISFKGNIKRTVKRGKGYGEGEILSYVLENSKYKDNIQCFAKITGRIKIVNINKILKRLDYHRNYFNPDVNLMKIVKEKKPLIDTRFYFVQVEFYNTFLKNLYRSTNDRKGIQIESCFFQVLKNKKYSNFPIYPNVVGICAGNGLDYSKEHLLKIFLFNLLSYINIFKCDILIHFI